jgi:hypothetical protein
MSNNTIKVKRVELTKDEYEYLQSTLGNNDNTDDMTLGIPSKEVCNFIEDITNESKVIKLYLSDEECNNLLSMVDYSDDSKDNINCSVVNKDVQQYIEELAYNDDYNDNTNNGYYYDTTYGDDYRSSDDNIDQWNN